jgi:hypothetical protein
MIQNEWTSGSKSPATELPDIRKLIKDFLIEKGEPAPFNDLLISIISELLTSGAVATEINQIDEGLFKQIQENLTAQLRDEHFTITYPTSQPGGSKWWLVDTREARPPLAERVEQFISNFLKTKSATELYGIEKLTCQEFKGVMTPAPELIHSVIVSYCEFPEPNSGTIQLRKEEGEDQRKSDLRETCTLLINTGKSFGFDVNEPETGVIEWKNKKQEAAYQFFLKSSCDIMGQIIRTPEDETTRQVFVLPGSRSRLIAYRLREDPRLASALTANWHFLKFRHLRRLAAMETLTFDLWEDLLDSDPLLWDAPEQTSLL